MQAIERLEDPLVFRDRDSRAFVAHLDRSRALDRDGDDAVAPAMLDGVLDQVGEGLFQRDPVAGHHDAGLFRFEREVIAGGNRQRRHVFDRMPRQCDKIERGQGFKMIEALQIEQLFGEQSQPRDVFDQAGSLGTGRQQFEAGLQDGDRCTQLMRRVGHEAAAAVIPLVDTFQRTVHRLHQRHHPRSARG